MRDCEKAQELINELEELSKQNFEFRELSKFKEKKEQLNIDIEWHLNIDYQLKKRHELALKHQFTYVGKITPCGLMEVKRHEDSSLIIQLLSDNEYKNTHYSSVRDIGEGLTAVYNNHDWSVLDENGKEIGEHFHASDDEEMIKGPFLSVSEAINGRIVVEKNDRYYLIDKNGRKISESVEIIKLGSHNVGAKNLNGPTNYVLFDTITGKELDPKIECKDISLSYNRGIALLQQDINKVIIFDCKNRKLIGELDQYFYNIYPISQDRFKFYDINQRNWYIIDAKGMKKGGPYQSLHNPSVTGVIRAQLMDNKWVFINEHGKQLSKREYDDMMDFTEGLAGVRITNDKNYPGGWYFIDEKENILPGGPYDNAAFFNYGVAQVKKNGKSFYIDTKGRNVFYNPYQDQENK